MRKSTFTTIIIFSFILIASFAFMRWYQQASYEKMIVEKNELCYNLTQELKALDKECYCYYSNFEAQQQELKEQTKALCACDCKVNETTVSIAYLVPNRGLV